MKFSIIIAVDSNNGIGKNKDLAWNIPSDLKYFKKLTSYTTDLSKLNAVIMGRKTWESIPSEFRPLSNRINCILSKTLINESLNTKIDDCTLYFSSLKHCLNKLKTKEKCENIFIIGGANIYNQLLNSPLLDKIYLTKIKGDFDCDVFFNGIPNNFILYSESEVKKEKNIEFSYQIWSK